MKKDLFELSRSLKIDGIPRAGIEEKIIAKPSERDALAIRLNIISLKRFETIITVEHEKANMFSVKGGIYAELSQKCIVTLEKVNETIRDNFDILMAPDYILKKQNNENIELEEVEPIYNGVMDLGEIATQYLAMSINQYPRKEGAVWEALFADESKEQDEVISSNPFLKLLKSKIKQKQ